MASKTANRHLKESDMSHHEIIEKRDGLALKLCIDECVVSPREDCDPFGNLVCWSRDYNLTDEIQADTRIPKTWDDITLEDLPVFSEWQRKLDKYYNR